MPATTPGHVYWILGAAALLLLLLVLFGLVNYFTQFAQELKYLNYEIQRTQGAERLRWIRRRRRLWLSLIPFVKY